MEKSHNMDSYYACLPRPLASSPLSLSLSLCGFPFIHLFINTKCSWGTEHQQSIIYGINYSSFWGHTHARSMSAAAGIYNATQVGYNGPFQEPFNISWMNSTLIVIKAIRGISITAINKRHKKRQQPIDSALIDRFILSAGNQLINCFYWARRRRPQMDSITRWIKGATDGSTFQFI